MKNRIFLPALAAVALMGGSSAAIAGAGINSATNPANPLIEWTQVHVPYCTADAHAGNNTIDYGYGEFNHVGRVNSQAAIDWIVQNYGSSAKVFA